MSITLLSYLDLGITWVLPYAPEELAQQLGGEHAAAALVQLLEGILEENNLARNAISTHPAILLAYY